MSHKTIKNPNECPTCEKSPCACPAKGGAGGDDTANEKKEESTTVGSNTIANVNPQEALITTAEQGRTEFPVSSLLTCQASFFGALLNNIENAPDTKSSNNVEENNSANTSMGMGMSMGGSDE
jgi:hypothetical protein